MGLGVKRSLARSSEMMQPEVPDNSNNNNNNGVIRGKGWPVREGWLKSVILRYHHRV